jgi:phospholipid N-methyltransferase
MFKQFPDKKTLHICEVGYGRGILADVICSSKSKDVEYFAIEANTVLAEKGRAKGHHISEGKIPPFPSDQAFNNFDIIIFSHVLEHFSHYDVILSVLEEAKSRLNSDGILIVFFPDYLDYGTDYYSADHSHEYMLTLRRMKFLLGDVRLQIVKQYSTRACFFNPFSMLIFPFHLVIKTVAGILWSITGNDLFFKFKITFARNIAIFAKKELFQ